MIVWKLDALMRQKRVKGRQLAKRMGIGENYLSRVRHEVPDRLSLSLLDALCRELECDLSDLLEYRPAEGEGAQKAVAPPPPVVARPARPAAQPVVLPEEVEPPLAPAEPAVAEAPVTEPEAPPPEVPVAAEPEPAAAAEPEPVAEEVAEPVAEPAPLPAEPAPPARAGFVLEIAPRPRPEPVEETPPPAPPRERPKLPIMPPLNARPQTPAPPPPAEPAAYVKGGALQAKLERLKRRR